MSFHYFFQKPPCDCFGTEHNEIIKAFCLPYQVVKFFNALWDRKNCRVGVYYGYSGQRAFSPTKNGIKIQLPPPENEKKNFSPLFSSYLYQDFEINFLPGASGTISTLRMSQMVEILISDLVLIAN